MISPEEYRTFFINDVLPHVPTEIHTAIQQKYPRVTLTPQNNSIPLAEMPVVMLVAFTGTGKTTALKQLALLREQGKVHYQEDIPTRRELADFIVIPTTQVISGKPVVPITDRIERFNLTAQFTQIIAPGGFAQAYSWLYYQTEAPTTLVSDGIRGKNEISYALNHNSGWRVFEIFIDTVSRLVRLSKRHDDFDQAEESEDLSFLPSGLRKRAKRLLDMGDITPQAIAIMHAEAQNYGIAPYAPSGTLRGYRILRTDRLKPHKVGQALAEYIRQQSHASS